jgi:TRAP-type C4-dicarboxylate transport system permease small subunit
MPEGTMDAFVRTVHRWLLALSCVGMLAAFITVSLGILARLLRWDIPGLDAYAGYAIAASLFLALPAPLEWWCLLAGTALSLYLSWYAARLVWVSHLTHDISPGADVTPLWIPQMAMAVGCLGLTLAFLQAVLHRWHGADLLAPATAARTE